MYTEAKKFIHATHILYQTTQSPVSWRYPESACKTKYICSLSKKTQHIFLRDKNLFCACISGDAPAKTCTRISIH